jgi:type VI secretion system protein ImpK
MRPEIAELVFPVLRKGIQVKEGLRTGTADLQFSETQKKFLALLQEPVPDHLRSEIQGDLRSLEQLKESIIGSRLSVYLGIRYALACWLDEIFIEDSPWKDLWIDNKIETTLYGTNLRASKFWEQAQRAQARPTRDALEVYYLCVMLGFRGDLFGKPAELTAWREAVEAQLASGEERTYSPPPGVKITPNVPELKGASVMQKRLLVVTVVVLLFIPLLVFLVSRS